MLHQALRRRGVQPLVSLSVDGGARADVLVGGEVTLRTVAEVSPGAGFIVALEWDFDGAGFFPVHEPLEPAASVVVERRWTPPGPGTYFPVVRVVATRNGDAASVYPRLQNLARVRVVVAESDVLGRAG